LAAEAAGCSEAAEAAEAGRRRHRFDDADVRHVIRVLLELRLELALPQIGEQRHVDHKRDNQRNEETTLLLRPRVVEGIVAPVKNVGR
jgi:hypothetical protein